MTVRRHIDSINPDDHTIHDPEIDWVHRVGPQNNDPEDIGIKLDQATNRNKERHRLRDEGYPDWESTQK